MHGLKGHVGEEGLAVTQPSLNKFDGFIDEKRGGVKILREGSPLPIGKPIRIVIDGEVGALLPVIRAGVHEGEGPLKAPGARKLIGLRA